MSKCIQKQENEYNLINVQNWIQLLASMYNYTKVTNNYFQLKFNDSIVKILK